MPARLVSPAATLLVAAAVLGCPSLTRRSGAQDRASVDRDAQPRVPLYGTFERQVTNTKTYSNPFDFQVVELKTLFTTPSGKTVPFFGFYDGDGKGGQTGHVWALRFMPD